MKDVKPIREDYNKPNYDPSKIRPFPWKTR